MHAASEILYNLSPDYVKLDPCTNFEEYVCGGWKDRHDLREDQDGAFTGTLMAEQSQLLLRHILEARQADKRGNPTAVSDADKANFEKMEKAYKACMGETAIKNAGVRPLLEVLYRIEDLFPADHPHTGERSELPSSELSHEGSRPEVDHQLSDVVIYIAKIGLGSIFDIYVQVSLGFTYQTWHKVKS